MFGNNLRAAREARGLTLDSLVILYKEKYPDSGLNKGTLSKYENGKQEPMASTVNNIAEILGVTSDFLLGREFVKKQEPEKNGFLFALSGEVKDYTDEQQKELMDYAKYLKHKYSK